MKRKLALSFLFVFSLALSAPVMSNAMVQEPEKKECEKKCEKKEKECTKQEKKECEKKAEKKECDKK